MTPIENLNLWTTANDLTGDTLRDWGQKINDNFAIVQSDTAQVQTNLDNHESDTTNPHSVTKTQVGLGNVDNTSDLNKPVSTATQTALDTKQNTSEKGVANWYAGLDGAGKVPISQLPDSTIADMTKATYDPQGIEADAFSMDNMVEGTDTKILTEAERTKLASVEANAQENTINDVVAGTNITIDKTDPLNPIFNASWWIAPVDSVNGETGVVVLDTDDIGEWVNKYVSQIEKDKLAGIEANADVTDSTNVDSAGAVMESDYSQAKSILAQQSGTWSPEVVQVGSNELVGRTSGGTSNIGSLSASEVRTILNVEDGATADQDLSGYAQLASANTFTDTQTINQTDNSTSLLLDQDWNWIALNILDNSTSSRVVDIRKRWVSADDNVLIFTEASWNTWKSLNVLNNGSWVSLYVDTNWSWHSAVFDWGNVWIGTTSPFQKAHIAESTNARMIIQETTWATWATSELLFQTSTTENFAKWAIVWEDTWLSWARWKLHLSVNNSTWAVNAWLADAKLTINNDGNVWIGTSSPDALLHIYENNTSSWASQWVLIEQDWSWDATLQFLRTWIRRWITWIDGSDNKFKISTWSQWLLLGNVFTIDTNGNIGLWWIISPDEKLEVNWRIALSQTTAPTVASWKAVQWVASGSGTKDGTAYDAGDVLWTSNNWGVSKTLIILNHSEI